MVNQNGIQASSQVRTPRAFYLFGEKQTNLILLEHQMQAQVCLFWPHVTQFELPHTVIIWKQFIICFQQNENHYELPQKLMIWEKFILSKKWFELPTKAIILKKNKKQYILNILNILLFWNLIWAAPKSYNEQNKLLWSFKSSVIYNVFYQNKYFGLSCPKKVIMLKKNVFPKKEYI